MKSSLWLHDFWWERRSAKSPRFASVDNDGAGWLMHRIAIGKQGFTS